jgi:drug/metabolite transporter (DMT)-like permease
MGVFPGAIAYLLWGYAFKYIKATAASSALYMVPIFTLILAAVFLAEVPNLWAVIGGIIAVAGSLVISRYGVCVPRKNQ